MIQNIAIMKKNIFYIIAASVLALCSCAQEIGTDIEEVVEGIPTTISLPFTVGDAAQVTTKLTLGDEYEGKLYNLYIAIYSNGNLMYSKYYDKEAAGQWEHVQENAGGHGKIDLDTYTANNCSIYAVANINVAMVNISPEKLKTVGITEDGLKGLVAKLNQEIVTRDGFFLMSGWMKGLTITKGENGNPGGIQKSTSATDSKGRTGSNVGLTLDRLDSKVTFNITCAAPDDPATHPTIKEFIPKKWQVVNLPLRSYLVGGVSGKDYTTFGNSEENYFDTPKYGFFHQTAAKDSSKYDTSSWSFYIMESVLNAKHEVTAFKERDRQEKEDGTGFNGAWKNAPDYGTYVILTGTVSMSDVDYKPSGVLEYKEYGPTMNAEVQYKIHLGDFSNNNFSDFSVRRNTSYTYNVTIKGVDDITVEVITSDSTDAPGKETEDAPGATGDVTLAIEAFKTVDAHYESFVHKFNYKNINQDMTWFVTTPFSKGQASTNPADYQWVKFRINKKETTDGKTVYSDHRRLYKPYDPEYTFDNTADYSGDTTPTMTVRELVTYLKTQADRKAHNQTNQFDDNDQIGVTAFVDEYYYDVDPRDNNASPALWKKFIGNDVEPRMMHILARTMSAYDDESWVTASTLSIKQLTIQSVYNPDSDVERLWGSEQIEESPVRRNMKWNKSGNTRKYPITAAYNHNGRYTSAREWGLHNGSNWVDTKDWSEFVDFESVGDTIRMKSDYNYLAYMCMTRNRDNNGNGKIDHSELRWYLATEDQIQELWIGDMSLSTQAKYYNPFKHLIDPRTGKPFWRCHYVTGSFYTSSDTSKPSEIWAEERGATGELYAAESEAYTKTPNGRDPSGPLHVRCMRNINTDLDYAIQEQGQYQPLIIKTGDNTNGFEFDLSRLSETNFREFRSQELIFGSDVSALNNRVSRKFAAAPAASNKKFSQVTFEEMNNDSRVGIGKQNPYCPDGYRMPNNRELLLMYIYLPTEFWTTAPKLSTVADDHQGFFSRTYSQVFYLGDDLDPNAPTQVSLMINPSGKGIAASHTNATTLRCVKDVFHVSVDD